MTAPSDLPELRDRVRAELEGELNRQRAVLAELGDDPARLVDLVGSLLRGGKRFRAAFCYWGYRGFGGTHDDAAVRAASAMELFQAAALIHDDVMDDSDVRRGAPTAHVRLADEHTTQAWSGEAWRFGLAGAILAGNLCLVWADEVMAGCGLPADELGRARPTFDQMRTQLMGGQFLDVLASVRGWRQASDAERLEQARRVVRYKSAKYSIQQPLLIGADAAGVDAADRELLSEYGLDLGEAFQLRDDVLGVFGDPRETGKPAGDDLREGKSTVLIALTLAAATPEQAAHLEGVLGRADASADDVGRAREIITGSGALARLEEMIAAGAARAQARLDAVTGLTDVGRAALQELTAQATVRTF